METIGTIFILFWMISGTYWLITLIRTKLNKKYKPFVTPVNSFLIAIAFFILGGIMMMPPSEPVNKNTPKQTVSKQSNFNKAIFDRELKIFANILFSNGIVKSYKADSKNNYYKLIITVDDDWYSLRTYQKERLAKEIGQAYAKIRILAGIENKSSNYPYVIFQDTYGSRVAKDNTLGTKVYK